MVKVRLKNKKINGITHLYDIIAEQLGFDQQKCRYNCTKIEVSEDIANKIESTYENKDEFAMSWIVFGPKVNNTLEANTVAIDTGFIEEEDE